MVLGICEIYQLLIFSSLGVSFYYEFLLGRLELPSNKNLISILVCHVIRPDSLFYF